MVVFNADGIPSELKEQEKWVVFILTKDGKKMPLCAKEIVISNHFASISDSSTWTTFDKAHTYYNYYKTIDNRFIGLGYALTEDSGIVFIDIDCHTDAVADDKKAELEKQYNSMVSLMQQFHTYGETSISGKGQHYLVKAELDNKISTGASPTMPIEIYNSKRFIIMTGNRLNDYEVADDEKTAGGVNNLHRNYFPDKPAKQLALEKAGKFPPIDVPVRPDKEVLDIALKDKDFSLLWYGKWKEVADGDGKQKYAKQHYADFVLMRKLCYYTENCPSQMERLFRQSPCYKAYGTGEKSNYIKFEADIKKDIKTTSSTCAAVYNPLGPLKKKIDLDMILQWLNSPDINERVFSNDELLNSLKSYCYKYREDTTTNYIKELSHYQRYIVDLVKIVRGVLGERLKYSKRYGSFYKWNGCKYEMVAEEDTLIFPITVVLSLVEHAVFERIVTDTKEQIVAIRQSKDGEKSDSEKQKEIKDIEKRALTALQNSKTFAAVKNARDVLTELKGMDFANDIVEYYESNYINMQNCVIDISDLDNIRAYPHSPIYNQSKVTGCNYEEGADCPVFKDMMKRLLPEEDTRRELQKAFGLCLAKEQLPAKKILCLLVGPKDTGKSTVLNTMLEVLGDYAAAVDNSLLMQSKVNKTRGPEMYDFRDTLMITTSETNENDKLDAAKAKALTGSTTQSVRLNYSNNMDKFVNIGIIFMDSNYKPYINRDEAVWDRIKLFPFICRVEKKNTTLQKQLAAERAGIFNWLIEGLKMVIADGQVFETPKMVEYKMDYRYDVDVLSQFINDCLVATDDKNDRIVSSKLFDTYINWCEDNRFKAIMRPKFQEEIRERLGIPKKTSDQQYIKVKYTDLGVLYSDKKTMTPIQFAKAKNELLDRPATLPYNTLKTSYFKKTWAWFVEHINTSIIKGVQTERYWNYCEWCSEYGYVPIKSKDFTIKVNWLVDNLKTPSPDAVSFEGVKDIWAD